MDEGDESARSDQLTGGRVQKAELQPGKGDVRITVNVPAFRMTLWQGDREIKSNYVGVGRKNFPIPIGMRSADRIILNPDWVPPNSAWVRRSPNVEPYERIPADDPNNPLGKIKIPLGQAYLLHEAQGPSDIGKLVSHGCIRVMRDDLFEVSSLIARALDLPISDRQIAAAREDNDRRVIKLGEDLPVDINYDTMVVESGILTIYPDVYGKNANTVENLRAELKAFGVDMSKLNDQILGHMLDKVNSDQKFVVAIEKLKGNAFEGKVEPLIPK
jgi:murein L,D-transpeptidase YcbB/YkuD